MGAFKNKKNGTWYVQFRYTDWKGERQQKLKRGFATKREAQEWERQFLMSERADINMTFEQFAKLYEKDIKPKLKLNTWITKESIIQKKIRVTPKFCVKSNECRNRANLYVGGSGLTVCRLCLQHNAGGDGCQGRRSRSFNP